MKKIRVEWFVILLLMVVAGLASCDGGPSNSTSGNSDTTAPSVPAGLSAAAVSSAQISLSWSASTDNIAVTGYKVYRGSALINTNTTTSYTDSELTPSTEYCYTVSAYDTAGNISDLGGPSCVTTLSAPTATSAEFAIATNPDTTTNLDQEMSLGAAFDGTNYLVVVNEAIKSVSAPSTNKTGYVTAQFISQSGALVGPRISVSQNQGQFSRIAFDGTNYLIIWRRDLNTPTDNTPYSVLEGQIISKTGSLVGSKFTIGESPTSQASSIEDNSIIFDGTNYFVAWEQRSNRDTCGCADIYGQFITPAGTLLGSSIPVSTALHGQRLPGLAFDGTNILSVWVDGRNQSACYTDVHGTHCFESDIYGQFITKSTSGTAGTLSGGDFLISASSLQRDNQLSLAFDGTNYFVLFSEKTTLENACPSGGCKWDIYGQLVTKTGSLSGAKSTITNSTPSHKYTSVVWNGSKYLLTWNENFGTSTSSIKGAYFDTYGASLGPEFTLLSTGNDGRVPFYATPLLNGSSYLMIVNRATPFADFEAATNADLFGIFVAP